MAVFTELHGKVKVVRNRRANGDKMSGSNRDCREMRHERNQLKEKIRRQESDWSDVLDGMGDDECCQDNGRLCPVTGKTPPACGTDLVELDYDSVVVLRYRDDGSLAGASVC